MINLLLGLTLALGVYLIWRSYTRKADNENRSALVRLSGMIDRSGERDHDAIEKKEKVKSDRSFIKDSFSRSMNRIAGRVERSSQMTSTEGEDFMAQLQRQLMLAGISERINPAQAVAIMLMAVGASIVIALFTYLGAFPPLIGVVGGIVVLIYPPLKLRSLRNARQETLRSEVPFFLQELTMALSTGALVLDTAIARVAEDSSVIGARSLLADEFRRAVREWQIGGLRREDAIRAVADRCGIQEVSNLVEALLTGAEMGTEGLVETLEQYGTQAREMWRNSIREYISKREPLITISLAITMFGGLILYAAPLIIRAITSISLA